MRDVRAGRCGVWGGGGGGSGHRCTGQVGIAGGKTVRISINRTVNGRCYYSSGGRAVAHHHSLGVT